MTQPIPRPACEACSEPTSLGDTIGRFHLACVERLLASQRRRWARSENGASLIEYVMLLALVAVFAIVGARAVGAMVPNLFDSERLGLAETAPAPVEVLGITLERPYRVSPCLPPSGANHATCPE